MGGSLSLETKILGSLYDSPPKELLPKSIHDHAFDQLVVLIDQPVGKSEPVRHLTVRQSVEYHRYTGIDLFPFVEIAPAHSQVSKRSLSRGLFLDYERSRNRYLG